MGIGSGTPLKAKAIAVAVRKNGQSRSNSHFEICFLMATIITATVMEVIFATRCPAAGISVRIA